MENCPLFDKCFKASGINCKGRSYTECELYKNLVTEHKHGKWKHSKPVSKGKWFPRRLL